MKFSKILRIMVVMFMLTGSVLLGASVGQAADVPTEMHLELTSGEITIGAPLNIVFPTTVVTRDVQNVDYAGDTGSGYFWVEDLKGSGSGYYTQLQLEDYMSTSSGGQIPAANVKAFVAHPEEISTALSGQNNPRVYIPSGSNSIGGSFRSLDVAVDFIRRDTAQNYGVVGKYGTRPTFRIVVPAYQAVGLYSGTLTYTLIEN